MSTPPTAKRRRVDSLGIHKPFVSPLKRNTSTTAATNSPSTTQPTSSTNQTSTPAPLRSQTATTPKATPYTPLRSSNLKTSTPLHHHTPHDPEIAQAQQDIKALEARIRVLRSQNGILAQAAQITTPASSQRSSQASQPSQPNPSSQQHQPQTRLTRLSQKWLRASQSAAEEVFGSFEQNINDNGGFATFLAQQKRSSTSNSFFGDSNNFNNGEKEMDEGNEDNWRDEEGDELTERGKRQRRDMIEEQGHKHRREKSGVGDEGEAEEAEEEEEEQELTLGVMLKVLNIDPEVIGWDTKTLAWK